MVRQGAKLLVLLLLLAVLATGCRGNLSTFEATDTPGGEMTQEAMLPTATPTEPPPPTVTREPTEVLPSPTPTLIPTDTPLPPTETPTKTEIPPTDTPTITPTEAPPTYTPYPTYTSLPSDTPLPTESNTPEPTLTPSPDRTVTARAEAAQGTEIAQALASTLDALPSPTPYPTYTLEPTDTQPPTITASPSFTPTATFTPSSTITPSATFTASPTITPSATYTPSPSFTPTRTPSATPDMIGTFQAATADALATQAPSQTAQAAAAISTGIAATLTAMPTATFTPVPTLVATAEVIAFGSYTAERVGLKFDYPAEWLEPEIDRYAVGLWSPDYQMAIFLARGDPNDLVAEGLFYSTNPVEALEEAVSGLEATISETDRFGIPAWDVVGRNDETAFRYYLLEHDGEWVFIAGLAPVEDFEVFEAAILERVVTSLTIIALPPTPSPSPSMTPLFTLTPYQFEVTLPPGPTWTPRGSVTPPVLVQPTLTPSLTPSPTGPTPDFPATATRIIAEVTATADAGLRLTATQIVEDYNATRAAPGTPTPAPPVTLNPFSLTATQLMLDLTSTAELYVTPTPSPTRTPTPSPTGPTPDLPATATQVMAEATATADADLRKTATQIVANVTATARAETGGVDANYLTATQAVEDFDATRAARVTVTPTWVPVTPMLFDMTQIATFYFTPSPVAVTPSATPMLFDLTQIATLYVTPSSTPLPTATPTPTFTSTPNWGVTATEIVTNATATAAARGTPAPRYEDEEFGVAFDVPDGWCQPYQPYANTLFTTDGHARVFIYRGDRDFFARRWNILRMEDNLLDAAVSVNERLDGALTMLVGGEGIYITVERGGRKGRVYLFALENRNWLILSASAPVSTFDGYVEDVFEPLLASLTADGQPVLAAPSALTHTPTPVFDPCATPSPFKHYESESLGLAFDAPVSWADWSAEDMFGGQAGIEGVAFYSNPEDISGGEPGEPSAPALVMARFDASEAFPDQRIDSPEAFLNEIVDIEPSTIQPYDAALYPAARALDYESTDDPALLVYVLDIGDGYWLVAVLYVPPDENYLLLDETVLQPVVRSVELLEESAPPATPTITLTPTQPPSTYTPSPLPTFTPEPVPGAGVFEPYQNEALGMAFDVPVGWVEWSDENMFGEQEGINGVLFYSNPEDVSEVEPGEPSAPALVIARLDVSKVFPNQRIDSPEDFLIEHFDMEADHVQPYDSARYPAARGTIEVAGELQTIMYVLQASGDDWLLVGMAVPPGYNALLLDETVVQPLVRSVELLAAPEPVTGEVAPVESMVFERYESEPLGLAFDVPAGWTAARKEESSFEEDGNASVKFFASRYDADSLTGEVTAPNLLVQRVNPAVIGIDVRIESPQDFLVEIVEVSRLFIQPQPYPGMDYPAARALAFDLPGEGDSMVYVMRLGDADWILVIFTVPPGADLLAWDEVIIPQLMLSLEVLVDSEPDISPAPTAVPLDTPAP